MKKHILKKLLPFLLVAVMLLSASGTVFAAEQNSADLVILYVNDVHCGVDAGSPEGSMGYANLAALKKEQEQTHDYVTLVDAGDAIQGEAIGTLSNGAYLVDIMNEIGFEYATFGNHEFDYGMDVARSLLTEANARYLACNFTDLKTDELGGVVGAEYADPYGQGRITMIHREPVPETSDAEICLPVVVMIVCLLSMTVLVKKQTI